MKIKAISLILIWAFLGMDLAWAAGLDALAPGSDYRSERETVETDQAEVHQGTLAGEEASDNTSKSLPTSGSGATKLASKVWPFLLIPVILNVMLIMSGCAAKKVVIPTLQEPIHAELEKRRPLDILSILQTVREGRVTIVGYRHSYNSPVPTHIGKFVAELKEAGLTHLVLEQPANWQGDFDEGKLDYYKAVMGPTYTDMITAIKKAGIKVVAGDLPLLSGQIITGEETYVETEDLGVIRLKTLRAKLTEQHIFKTIIGILRKDPKAKVVLLIGALHVGPITKELQENGVTAKAIFADREEIIQTLIVEEFMDRLRTDGLLSEPLPLYNAHDTEVMRLYRTLLAETGPKVESRDTTSWEEIKISVATHLMKHPKERALIIIEGAASHIWGAVPFLEGHHQARYISTTHRKLDVETIRKDTLFEFEPEETGRVKAKEELQSRLRRSLGVVKHLGYESLEAFIQDRHKHRVSKHVMIGLEETGLHELYVGGIRYKAYNRLVEFLGQYAPTSILYIGENLSIGAWQKDFDTNFQGSSDLTPSEQFLLEAKIKGIPVEFGAFGFLDGQPLDRQRRRRLFEEGDEPQPFKWKGLAPIPMEQQIDAFGGHLGFTSETYEAQMNILAGQDLRVLKKLLKAIDRGRIVYLPILTFDIERARPITFAHLTDPDLKSKLTRAGIKGRALTEEEMQGLICLGKAIALKAEGADLGVIAEVIEEAEWRNAARELEDMAMSAQATEQAL